MSTETTMRRQAECFKKLRNLMGYVQDASECTISVFEDDATGTFWIKARCMSKELWSEWGDSLEEAIEKADRIHGEQ